MSDKALTPIDPTALMPVFDINQAVARRDQMIQFVRQIMVKDVDYGRIPGTAKDTLYKPGAEKLSTFFGLTKKFAIVKEVENWDSAEPFFYYFYRCQLLRGDMLIAEGDGSCNSRESKYRWRWVGIEDVPPELNPDSLMGRRSQIGEFEFAIKAKKTDGRFGKPLEYWQEFDLAISEGRARCEERDTKRGASNYWVIDSTAYRIPNPDIADQVNTLQKMAQKRALIAATLLAVNASEYFTQDLEDFADGEIVTSEAVIVEKPQQGNQPPPPPPQQPEPEPETQAPPKWMGGMLLQAEMDYGLSDEQVIQLLRSRGVKNPQERAEAQYKGVIDELMSAPNNPIAVMVAVNLHLSGAGKEKGYTSIHHLKNSIIKQMEFDKGWAWPASASGEEWAEATQAAIDYGMERAK
jgi:hypothetical protein